MADGTQHEQAQVAYAEATKQQLRLECFKLATALACANGVVDMKYLNRTARQFERFIERK